MLCVRLTLPIFSIKIINNLNIFFENCIFFWTFELTKSIQSGFEFLTRKIVPTKARFAATAHRRRRTLDQLTVSYVIAQHIAIVHRVPFVRDGLPVNRICIAKHWILFDSHKSMLYSNQWRKTQLYAQNRYYFYKIPYTIKKNQLFYFIIVCVCAHSRSYHWREYFYFIFVIASKVIAIN